MGGFRSGFLIWWSAGILVAGQGHDDGDRRCGPCGVDLWWQGSVSRCRCDARMLRQLDDWSTITFLFWKTWWRSCSNTGPFGWALFVKSILPHIWAGTSTWSMSWVWVSVSEEVSILFALITFAFSYPGYHLFEPISPWWCDFLPLWIILALSRLEGLGSLYRCQWIPNVSGYLVTQYQNDPTIFIVYLHENLCVCTIKVQFGTHQLDYGCLCVGLSPPIFFDIGSWLQSTVLSRQPHLSHGLGYDGGLCGVVLRELFLSVMGSHAICVVGLFWHQLLGHLCSDNVLHATSLQIKILATMSLAVTVGGCGRLVRFVAIWLWVVGFLIHRLASC